MGPSRASGLLLLAFVAVLGAASPAHAWTRTVVQSARAKVDIQSDGTLAVLLRLDVVVHAGWLHELELVGLGSEVDLDRYRPPYFRSEEGEVFRPEIEEREDGSIRLWFPRKDAPRRGEYRGFLRYRARADVRSTEEQGATVGRVVWSVPAWETGLHNVSVELRAPKGSTVPAEMRELSPGVELDVAEHPNRTVATWQRIHLPRMTEWPLSLDVPADAIALPASESSVPSPPGFRPMTKPEQTHLAWALALLATLVLLKRWFVETKMGREQLVIRCSWPTVLALTAIVVATGQWMSPNNLACGAALIALALHRPMPRHASAVGRKWQAASSKDLPKARIHASDLLDATGVSGLAMLIAYGAMHVALGEPDIALLSLPVFLSGTRHHCAAPLDRVARLLRDFAAKLWLPDDAPNLSFAWQLADDGTPRLRAHLSARRAGLLAVSFAVTSSTYGFLQRQRVMLIVETRAQSEADDLVRRRTRVEPDMRASNGGILRIVEWDSEALELLRVLAREAPRPMKASRGTWLLREISEPGRKAA